MLSYKEKHASQLQLGHKLRQIGVVLPLAATLSMGSCGHSGDSADKRQESGLLAYDSIQDEDYFGRTVTLKHVSINLYKDRNMKPTQISQLRWGTPKEEMPDIYHGEKTFAKKVRYGGVDDYAYIEVFENEYGVLISKDQPCFIVDKHNTLVYFGNAETFSDNMYQYVKGNNFNQIKSKPAHEKPIKVAVPIVSDTISADTLTEDINSAEIDSFLLDTNKENMVIKTDSDTVRNESLSIDTLLKKKDNPVKE